MRNFVAAMLAWGTVTNVLLFLPSPRNLPVALCKKHGEFFALEVAFETKDGSPMGNPKTDSLLLAGGILSLVSACYCFAWFVVQQGRRNSVRNSSPYVVAPVLSMSVATLFLFVISILRCGDCIVASGSFVKIAEVVGISLLCLVSSERRSVSKEKTDPSRRERSSPAPVSQGDAWDPSSISLGFK